MRFGRRKLSSDDLVPLTNCHRAFSKRTLKRLLGKKKEGAKGWDESAYWTYPDIIKRLRAAVKRGVEECGRSVVGDGERGWCLVSCGSVFA